MLANAGFAQAVQAWTLQQEQQIMLSGLILVAYWLLSLWLGAWFERYVEVPLTRWRAKPA
jgi:peptidoglycan/LPS O-acetylase OafA/YrhL